MKYMNIRIIRKCLLSYFLKITMIVISYNKCKIMLKVYINDVTKHFNISISFSFSFNFSSKRCLSLALIAVKRSGVFGIFKILLAGRGKNGGFFQIFLQTKKIFIIHSENMQIKLKYYMITYLRTFFDRFFGTYFIRSFEFFIIRIIRF